MQEAPREVHANECRQELSCFQEDRVRRAVGIELKTLLKARKSLILLNEKNDKNTKFTQVRYTPGTRKFSGTRDLRVMSAISAYTWYKARQLNARK